MVEFFSMKIKDYWSKVKNGLGPHQISLLVCYYFRDLDFRMICAFTDLNPNSEPRELQIQFWTLDQIMNFIYRFSLSCR